MSTATIAQLVVSLEANIAKFSTDIRSAAATTQQAMSTIESAANVARNALGALGVGLSAGAVVAWGRGVIEAAAALDDFAEATGSSVENLSRLTNQAKVAGVSSDVLQTAITKLAAGMNGVDDESTKIGQALAQLGITAKDPAEAFREIALTMDRYADGTGKAAFLADVFGKNWAAVMPALKAVVEEQDIQASVTATQAAEAEQLEKNWNRLSAQAGILKTALLSDLVPALNEFIAGIKIARAEGLGWWDSLNVGTTYADRVVPSIARIGGQVDELRAKIEKYQKFGSSAWWETDSWVAGLIKEMKNAEAQLKVLIALRDRAIMSNVAAMGYTGDARDQMAGNFGAGKPTLDYRSQTDGANEAKVAVANYADEIQKLNDLMLKMSSAGGSYDNLARATEKIAADQRAGKVVTSQQSMELQLAAFRADELTAELKANADAWDAHIKALQDAEKAQKAFDDAIKASNMTIKSQNDALKIEHATLGMTSTEREIYVARMRLAEAAEKGNTNAVILLNEQLDLLAQKSADEALLTAMQGWGRVLDDVTHGLGNFFTDLLENGQSAFKRLWDNFKHWALSALAEIAAKQVVVSVIGAVTGAAAGSAAASIGGSALGAAGGSVLNGLGTSLLGGTALGGLGAMGADFAFGMANSTAIISEMLAGNAVELMTAMGAIAPWAAIAAIAIPLIISAMDEGPAMRSGTWMSSTSTMPRGNPLFQGSSAFGSFGVVDDRWFSDSDMGTTFKSFLAGITSIDNAISALVGKDMTGRISEALAAVTTGFTAGIEHETVTFGDIVGQRYVTVLNTIDQGLGDLLLGFSGTGEEMAKFVIGIVQVHEGLRALNLKGLDITALQGFQQAGETLPDTFSRISSAYLQFVNNFTSDADKLNDAQTLVTSTFSKLGIAIPENNKAYLELVKSIDLSTEAGRSMWATLITISPAFLQVQSAAEAAKKAALELANAMSSATGSYAVALAEYNGASSLDIANLKLGTAIDLMARNVPGFSTLADALGATSEQLAKLTPEQIAYVTSVISAATAVKQATAAINDLAMGVRPIWQTRGGSGQDRQARTDTPAMRDAAAAAVAINDALSSLADLADPVSAAMSGMATDWEKLIAQGNALETMTAYYDGSADSTVKLATATRDYYNAVVQTLSAIQQMKVALHDAFASNIQTFTMAGMDKSQQYTYLQGLVNGWMEELKTATDPSKINWLSSHIQQTQMQAWGLLSPQQQALLGPDFITGAKAADALTQEKLAAAEKAATERYEKLLKDVHDELTSAAKKFSDAADKQDAAGDKQKTAADKIDGATITVRVEDARSSATGSYGP